MDERALRRKEMRHKNRRKRENWGGLEGRLLIWGGARWRRKGVRF
jgi:hypothetical protein